MCIRLVERYSVCRCLYYGHSVDPCRAYGKCGHETTEKTILVGVTCPRHTPRRRDASPPINKPQRTLRSKPPERGTHAPAEDVDRVLAESSGLTPVIQCQEGHSQLSLNQEVCLKRKVEELSHGSWEQETFLQEEQQPLDIQSNPKQQARLLACPYYKHDPLRYSERNVAEKRYRGCSSSYLLDIARLKQHLHRVHEQPKAYCGRCYAVFANRKTLDEHLRTPASCPVNAPQFQERMTDEQSAQIRIKEPKKGREESWFGIWRILFPSEKLPDSPYMDDTSDDVSRGFLQFFRRKAPAEIVTRLNASHMGVSVGTMTAVLDTTIASLVEQWSVSHGTISSSKTDTDSPPYQISSVLNGGNLALQWTGDQLEGFQQSAILPAQNSSLEPVYGGDAMLSNLPRYPLPLPPSHGWDADSTDADDSALFWNWDKLFPLPALPPASS